MKNHNKRVKQSLNKKMRNAIPKHCSNCGTKYKKSDLVPVKKTDFGALYHLRCSKCQESYLINVVSQIGDMQGSNRIPIRVDISSSNEARRFIGKKFVSPDDVLDTYDLLKNVKSAKEFKDLL